MDLCGWSADLEGFYSSDSEEAVDLPIQDNEYIRDTFFYQEPVFFYCDEEVVEPQLEKNGF